MLARLGAPYFPGLSTYCGEIFSIGYETDGGTLLIQGVLRFALRNPHTLSEAGMALNGERKRRFYFSERRRTKLHSAIENSSAATTQTKLTRRTFQI